MLVVESTRPLPNFLSCTVVCNDRPMPYLPKHEAPKKTKFLKMEAQVLMDSDYQTVLQLPRQLGRVRALRNIQELDV